MALGVVRRRSSVRGVAVGVPKNAWSRWRKSRHSASGNCVEVRLRAGVVQVRDSKDPRGPALRYTQAEWRAFIAGAKDGEFDLPA
jgi:uncharacterized protein DUF397